MHSNLVIFRVCQKEKWLIPLCRGLQGGSSGRCLVRNGGLWWLEMASERSRSRCRRWNCSAKTLPEIMAEFLGRWWRVWWRWGGVKWLGLITGVVGLRRRERQKWPVFREREGHSEREQDAGESSKKINSKFYVNGSAILSIFLSSTLHFHVQKSLSVLPFSSYFSRRKSSLGPLFFFSPRSCVFSFFPSVSFFFFFVFHVLLFIAEMTHVRPLKTVSTAQNW